MLDLKSDELEKYAQLAMLANEKGLVIHKHENGEYELIDQLTFHTCIYKNGKWIQDDIKLREYQENIYKNNKKAVDKLISEASIEIDILKDKAELGEDNTINSELLLKWKAYRISLKDLDLNDVNLQFPETPYAS